MRGLGTIINFVLIIAGGGAGLLLKSRLSARLTDTLMQAMGLAVVVVGLCGTLSAALVTKGNVTETRYLLVTIVSLAIGTLIGEWINIEAKLEAFGRFFESKFNKRDQNSSFAQGFVTASLVFCIGAMAIVGSIEDGATGNPEILIAKSTIDCVTAMLFASTMGFGVLFSAVSVGTYQGIITLLAVFIAPYLSDTVIAQMSMVGSVLIIAIGFNLLKISRIKVGNMLPAVFVPIAVHVINRCLNI